MKEVSDVVVKKIISKMFRDATIEMSGEYFIILTYKFHEFKDIIDEETFNNIIGFLPNMNYKGLPFIMSVVHNKFENEYEITVHNPRLKF